MFSTRFVREPERLERCETQKQKRRAESPIFEAIPEPQEDLLSLRGDNKFRVPKQSPYPFRFNLGSFSPRPLVSLRDAPVPRLDGEGPVGAARGPSAPRDSLWTLSGLRESLVHVSYARWSPGVRGRGPGSPPARIPPRPRGRRGRPPTSPAERVHPPPSEWNPEPPKPP